MLRLRCEVRPPTLLVLALAGAACGGGQTPPADARGPWPEGTVLLVGERPVEGRSIDPLAEALATLEPATSLAHRRRLAILHLTVPLERARALADEAVRRGAREGAEAFWREARDIERTTPGPQPVAGMERREGDFLALGIPLWYLAQGLEPGAWSGVEELPGAYVVVQLLSRTTAVRGVERHFELLEARFPYLEPERVALEAARARVTPVDPDWEPAVPGLLRYR